MYKCGAMASNCGECLTTESKFKCGWCSDRCTTINECPATVEWLDRDRDCPDPVINKVSSSISAPSFTYYKVIFYICYAHR